VFFVGFGLDSPEFLLALGWTAPGALQGCCWLWAGQPCVCCCLDTLWLLVAFGLDSPGLKLFTCLQAFHHVKEKGWSQEDTCASNR